MNKIEFIAVHCSATRPDWMAKYSVEAKRDEIERWHMDRGWQAIGYARIIDRDGSVAVGRDLDGDGDPWEEIGAHIRGKNSVAVGVCLLGGHGSTEFDDFEDHFTPAQDKALRETIQEIRKYAGRNVPVHGHNEFSAKACPGFQVDVWMAEQPLDHVPVRRVPFWDRLRARLGWAS